MKYAADFRSIARDALRGRWPVAIWTGFVASLIGAGAVVSSGGGGSSNSNRDHSYLVEELREFFRSETWFQIKTFVIVALVLLLIWMIVTIVISGAGRLGYARFNLNLVDYKEAALSDLFSQFHRLGDGFCMNFLVALYLMLWSLLFVIPGIIKGYSYAMTPYILLEHPEMTVTDAITESRAVMDGNKWRLFCLEWSFIGWDLLCSAPLLIALGILISVAVRTESLLVIFWLIPLSIPLNVGCLFLRPYKEAAYAAFYRDVSGTEAEAAPALNEASNIYTEGP